MRNGIRRFIILSLVWFGLNGWVPRSWIIGIPSVFVATWVSLYLVPVTTSRISWRGIPAFLWYFLRKSVYGGIDVALRTLRPVVNLDPGIVEYDARLVTGTALVFVSGTISLLPGTLSVSLQKNRIRVHVLDVSAPIESELQELERLVANLLISDSNPTRGRRI
jgi:multicomponent Na+:H+ antiporter subunit E